MPRLSAPSRRDCSPDSALAARSRRGGVPSLHRCIAAVAAATLFVLACLALAVPARADVLVSNLGQASGGGGPVGSYDKAQAFTTGADTFGYTVTSVELVISQAEPNSVYTVSIWSSNATGRPNSLLGTLTNPASLTNGANTFAAAGSGIDMSASTTYLVFVDATSGTSIVKNVNSASSADAEDASSATGWSIADDSLYRTAGSTGDWTTFNESMYIRVNGATKNTVPGAPQDFAVSAGDAQVVLTWTAPTSDGGAAITEYEYRYSTGSTVSSSATWTDVTDGSDAGTDTDDELGVTVSSLTNGTGYAFEVRAVNSVGGGTATATKTATPSATSCAMPYFGDRRSIWTGTVTVGDINQGGTTLGYGFTGGLIGSLDDKTFTISSNDYEIDNVAAIIDGNIRFSLKDSNLTSAEKAALRLHVCNTTYNFSAAILNSAPHDYTWTANLDWSSLSNRALYLSLPPNNAATGAPTISGTAAVGHTLMAATGTIADTDGVPTTFTYQWIRVDGSDETDISGATGSTYLPADADAGKKVKVKVSFTDDLGGMETRTSAAYPSAGMIITVPGAPQDFAVLAGHAQVVLTWTAPTSDGGAAITEYEYRYSEDAAVAPNAIWTDVADGSDNGNSTADETGVTI